MKADIMPHSPSAEQAVIGALLINPENFTGMHLEPEEFYIERNRWIYAAMLDLRRDGREPDYVSVCAKLDERGQLQQAGGPAYVTSLINACPSSLNAETYAATITDRARRRRCVEIARTLTGAAFEDDGVLEAAVARGMDDLSRLLVSPDKGAAHISNYVSAVYDEVNAAVANPREFYGIQTGVLDYDRITAGLQRGEVVKLSGEPGIGKTLLALQMARGMADPNRGNTPGVIYSLEMSGRALARRQLSALSHIETRRLRSGDLTEDDLKAFVGAVESLSALPIYIWDHSQATTAEIRADLERLKASHGIGWALIDYEGLINDEPGRDETERSRVISSRVHGMIKDLDIAGLVIDDMNKGGIDNASAGKANLSGSARKIYDADAIWLLKKTDMAGIVMVQCTKFREGDPDKFFKLRRVPGFPAFQDMAKEPKL